MRVTKKPTEYDAVLWTGDNIREIEALIGRRRLVHIDNTHMEDRLLVLKETGMEAVAVDTWILYSEDTETIKTVRQGLFESQYEEV